MKQQPPFSIGQVVTSLKGRDGGKSFLVFQIVDDCFCTIVDGRFHKLARPKRKRMKHLRPEEQIETAIRDKWLSGKNVFDSEVASTLKERNYRPKPIPTSADPVPTKDISKKADNLSKQEGDVHAKK